LPGKHQDTIAQQQGFVHIVRDENHGFVVLLPELQQFLLEFEPRLAVQGGERLIHQHDRRVAQKAPNHGDARLHTQRKLVGVGAFAAPKAVAFQQRPRARLALLPAAALHFQAKCGVFKRRHPREQTVLLKNHLR